MIKCFDTLSIAKYFKKKPFCTHGKAFFCFGVFLFLLTYAMFTTNI